MVKARKITVNENEISVFLRPNSKDFISLTDMTKSFDGGSKLIEKWLNTKNTIEYIGVWERLNNPNFNSPEFGGIYAEMGSNKFYISVNKFISMTNAIGIEAKTGRYGGTYAHTDIAFHFAMWLSPEFNLLVIKEFQRLIEKESNPLLQQWDFKRLLAKTNYALHTDAIKNYIIPKLSISKAKERIVYADEADMMNIILFGCTAKDWEESNPDLAKNKMNLRDTATINQLVVLTNMESFNSELIKQNISRPKRFQLLHAMAKEQLSVLDKSRAEQKFRKQFPQNNMEELLE